MVNPYVQPGDGTSLDGTDVRVLTWLTDTEPGNFTVEYQIEGQPTKTARIEITAINFPKYSAGPKNPASDSHRPQPPALTLEELKNSVIQSFASIPERDQHYLRYRATLEELPLDSVVSWRVHSDGKEIRKSSVKTRASAKRPIRFAAVGDMASNRPEALAVAYQVDCAKPDFMIALGDIVYPGGRALQYFNHFFPVYNDVNESSPKTGAPLMASVPVYPVIGNHDTEQQKLPAYPDAYSCFHWFSVPKNGPGKGPWNAPLGKDESAASTFMQIAGAEYPAMHFYSFDNGAAHFLVLDANKYSLDALPGVLPWIERDLLSSKQRWKIVCFHQPAFHTSREHYSEQRMRLLEPLFEKAGVDLVLAGHVHNYQRSFPLRFEPNPEGPDKRGRVNGKLSLDDNFDGVTRTKPRGIIHVVSGGGGAKLYSVDLAKTVEILKKEHSENYQPLTAKYVPDHGFTLIDLNADSLKVRQINAEGREVDNFLMTK